MEELARSVVEGRVAFERAVDVNVRGGDAVARRERFARLVLAELEEGRSSCRAASAATAACVALCVLQDAKSGEATRLARQFVQLAEAATRGPATDAKKMSRRAIGLLRARPQAKEAVLRAAEQNGSATVAPALVGAVELFVDRWLSRTDNNIEGVVVAVHDALKPMLGVLTETSGGKRRRPVARTSQWVESVAMGREGALRQATPALGRSLKRSPASASRVSSLVAAAGGCAPEDAASLAAAAVASTGNTLSVFEALSKFGEAAVAAAVGAIKDARWPGLAASLGALATDDASVETAEKAVGCLLKNDEAALEALCAWAPRLDPSSSLAVDVAALATKELETTKKLGPALRLVASVVEPWAALFKPADLDVAMTKARRKATMSSATVESRRDHGLCLYALAVLADGKLDWTKDEALAFDDADDDDLALVAACGLARLTKLKNCPVVARRRAWACVATAAGSAAPRVKRAAERAVDAISSSSGLVCFYQALWTLLGDRTKPLNYAEALRNCSKGTNLAAKAEREYAALVCHHPRTTRAAAACQSLWHRVVVHRAQRQAPSSDNNGEPLVDALTSGNRDQIEAAALSLEVLFHTAHYLGATNYRPKAAALEALASHLEATRKLAAEDLKAYLGRIQKEEDAPGLFLKPTTISKAASSGSKGKNAAGLKKKKDDTSMLLQAAGLSSSNNNNKSKTKQQAAPPKPQQEKHESSSSSFEAVVAAAAARVAAKAAKAKSLLRAAERAASLAPDACTEVWPGFLSSIAETAVATAVDLDAALETSEFDDLATGTCAELYRAAARPRAPRHPRQTGRAVALAFAPANTRKVQWSADDEVAVAAAVEDVAANLKGVKSLTPLARLGSRVACAALEHSAAARSRRPKAAVEALGTMSHVLGIKARAAALKALVVTSARSGDDKEPAAVILSLCCNAPETDAHVLVPPLLGVEKGAVAPLGVFDAKARVRCGVLAACLILVSRCGAVLDVDQMVCVWIASFFRAEDDAAAAAAADEIPDGANLMDELSDVFADSRDLLPRDVFGCRGVTKGSGATVDAKARMLARAAWARMLEDGHHRSSKEEDDDAGVVVWIDDNFKAPIASVTRVALVENDDPDADDEYERVRSAARRALASLASSRSSSEKDNAATITAHLREDFDAHAPDQANKLTKQKAVVADDADPEAYLSRPPDYDPVAEAREMRALRDAEQRKVTTDARRRERVAKTLAECVRRIGRAPADLLGWARARLGDPDADARQAVLDVGAAIVDADVDAALDTLFALSQKSEEKNSTIRLGVTALLGRAAKSLGEGDGRVADVADQLISALTSAASDAPVVDKKNNNTKKMERTEPSSSHQVRPQRKANATTTTTTTTKTASRDLMSNKATPMTGAAAITGMVGAAPGTGKKMSMMNVKAAQAKRQATVLRASLTESTKRKASAAELQRRQAEGILSEASSSAPVAGVRSYEALAAADEAAQRSIADGLVPVAKSLKKQGERGGELVDRLAGLCFGGGLEGSALRRKGAARGLAAAVKGLGITALKQRGVVGKIEAALDEASSIDDKHGGLVAVECLAERLGVLFEPYEIALLPSLLRCFGDGTELVREAAKSAARKVFEGLSAHGVKLALPTVLEAAAGGEHGATHWRPRVAAIGMLGTAAHCAPKQLGAVLPKAVPALASALGDTHPKVREAAKDALADVGSVAKNPEIKTLRAELLEALSDPAHATRGALDALLAREFAHTLDAPSVALVAPIIQRGLRDRLAETKRRAAVVLGNLAAMSSAAADTVGPHLASLQPLLEAAAVADAHPDVRFSAAMALAQVVGSLGIGRVPFAVERLCNAALARRASSPEIGDIIAVKSTGDGGSDGGLLAGAASGSSERAGAAQALAAVLRELGDAAIAETLTREVIPISRHASAAGREGALWVVRYATRDEQFDSSLVPEALAAVLEGLADDADPVRETALVAGKQLVRAHGETELPVLLPSLEGRLLAPTWRIRAAAATLIGELLYVVGDAKPVGFSERDAEADDALGDEATAAAIERAVGKAAWRNTLASLYIARLDAVAAVRAAALDVWKTVVPNTPRALREILATLVKRLVSMLAPDDAARGGTAAADTGRRRRQAAKAARRASKADEAARSSSDDEESDSEDDLGDDATAEGQWVASRTAERQRVASRTLGDVVKKIGDRVIPELIPLLRESFDAGDEATRVGVCLGLAEVAAAASKQQALEHLDALAPAIESALLRPHGEGGFSEIVISHAAVAFHELHGTVGSAALEAIVPKILARLEDDDEEAAIVAAREISRRRARELLAVVVPKLLATRPLSANRARAASAIADVAGALLGPYVGSVARAVIADLSDDSNSAADLLVACAADVAANAAVSGDASSVVNQLASPFASSHLARCAATVVAAFFANLEPRLARREDRRAPINEAAPRLLKELVVLLADPDPAVRAPAVSAIAAYSTSTPVDLQVDHLEFLRVALSSTSSDARLRLKREVPVPAISEDPAALAALLPPYLHALLHGTPEKRESAASGIAELVDLATETSLKKHAVKIAGPLIRVVGDRFSAEVRAAILNALAALLRKSPLLLKAFVPQLQASFSKSLRDPASRPVRLRALAGLKLLVPLSPRLDPLVGDLVSHARPDDDPDVALSMLHGLAAVFANLASGKTIGDDATSRATRLADSLSDHDLPALADAASALKAAIESRRFP
ncbi:hypothetical protein CTAYLR_007440 [Chrysophaeum taylorii]|uniref:TOG domain-containing protein n=1 Tax=Chrysophaeum taylorii TaxID=2483200 RepID=A0AAD7U998_9STRA|nr:hypothetical protein CTAYLR_007440 [Chrysophaeum taylorii]